MAANKGGKEEWLAQNRDKKDTDRGIGGKKSYNSKELSSS